MGLKNFFKHNETKKIDVNAFNSLLEVVTTQGNILKGILQELKDNLAKQDQKIASIDALSIKRDENLESKISLQLKGLSETIEKLKNPKLPSPPQIAAPEKPTKLPNPRKRK
jgi:hypothetical protein